jgi:peroxiredoxin
MVLNKEPLMKRYLAAMLFTILAISIIDLNAQNFSVKPAKPVPGEKITVKFNPEGTHLEKSDKVEMFAYIYKKDLTDTKSSMMKKDGKQWTASFTTDKNDLGVIVIFRHDEVSADNEKKGYVINLYDKKGEILPGSLAGLGYAYFTWGTYYLGFDRDPVLANELFNQEFQKNPGLKEEYVKYYIPAAATISKEKSIDVIKEGISVLEKKSELNEEEYSTLIEYYKRISDPENAAKYEKIALEKFTTGTAAQMKDAAEINQVAEVDQKIAKAKEFSLKYPESKYLPGIHNQITKKFFEAKDFSGLKNFVMENKENIVTYFFHNAANRIMTDSGDVKLALELAEEGLKANLKNSKKDERPEYLSESEWKKVLDETTGQLHFARGRALYELDRKKEALKDLEKAAAMTEYENTDINFHYAKALFEAGKSKEAYDKTAGFIAEGFSSTEIDSLFKEIYVKVKGNGNGYKEEAAALTKKSYKKIAAKLESEMINEPAPKFSLVDLNGNEVALDQFKGKTVILDFWATWCGPCLQSFPGLKTSVEKHKDNESVKFLFINTWERVENKKENAEQFIAKNSYPFHVLLDLENKVIEQYKVSGIPTKFIIDKNGNIRFKSVGYSGSVDKLITEIDVMISMLE